MRGLILEGIPAVGKSRVLSALRGLPSFQERTSTLILGEHYTERAVEQLEELSAVRYERLMYRILAALEPLRVLSVEGRVFGGAGEARRLRYVLERFHLTNVLNHGHGDGAMLRRVENTLRVYEPVVVLCVVDPGLVDARLRDTLDRRSPCWRDYLARFGETWDQIVAHFVAQQREFRSLLAESVLETRVLDLSDEAFGTAAEGLDRLLDEPVPARA